MIESVHDDHSLSPGPDPYRWIPTEGGEHRAIVGGVVLTVQAFGGPSSTRIIIQRRPIIVMAKPERSEALAAA